MAYGDLPLDAPEKPNKGHEGGACNRRACQSEPALWYNHGSYSWYCESCAIQIGKDHVNEHHWYADFARFFPRQERFPMFETRDMMLERIKNGAGEHTMPKVTFDSPVSSDVIVEKLARQQGKTMAQDRRYHVMPGPTYINRQQRRAAERAAFKRLPKR